MIEGDNIELLRLLSMLLQHVAQLVLDELQPADVGVGDLVVHGSTHVNHEANALIRLSTHQNVGHPRGMHPTEILVDVMVPVWSSVVKTKVGSTSEIF